MSELDDQSAFATWLDRAGIVYFWQRTDKRTTGTKGWPDFTIVRNDRALLLEFKDAKGALSPDQKALHKRLCATGSHPGIVRSVKEAMEITNLFLCLADVPSVPASGKTEADPALYRHGQVVFKKTGKDRYDYLRKATPEDASLPTLK